MVARTCPAGCGNPLPHNPLRQRHKRGRLRAVGFWLQAVESGPAAAVFPYWHAQSIVQVVLACTARNGGSPADTGPLRTAEWCA